MFMIPTLPSFDDDDDGYSCMTRSWWVACSWLDIFIKKE